MAKAKKTVKKTEAPAQPPAAPPVQPTYTPQPVTATQLMTSDSTKAFIVAFAVIIFVVFIVFYAFSGDFSGVGGPCSETSDTGGHLCGYCNQDAMTSGNPNAGKCRYCPAGTDCIYDDICGELKCRDPTVSGGTSGGSGTQQYCSSGYCYSAGYCCPSYARYYCNGGCYDSAGANQAGCYSLKATCY